MNFRAPLTLAALFVITLICGAQSPTAPRMPPDYRGPQIYVPGIFVTPTSGAAFTATVEIVSHQLLPDGTENVRTTVNHIARDSAGRIYNERRALVPTTFKGEPRLLSAHIYDPNSGQNIFYEPMSRIARQTILVQPPVAPPNSVPPKNRPDDPAFKELDLGDQSIDGTTLHGIEKQHILDANSSGTGKPVTVTDDYWYSSDLAVYLIIKHNDPRTGEQIVAVTHIDRHEPESTRFIVPDTYKVVDETPPTPIAPSIAH